MLPHSSENEWLRRTRWLTQALIISGTLNIGLIATFVYFSLKERQETLALELPAKEIAPSITNAQALRSYSLLPYQELLLRLENDELLEDGLTKRDLALACLVAFHNFNLDKALGNLPPKKILPFTNNQETIDIAVFPGLADTQFQAIAHYAKTEKWPFTSQGLFYELKRSNRDPSLLEAFYLSPEFHTAYTLLTKTGVQITHEQLIDLICEGEWSALANLSLDLSPESKRAFLSHYLNNRSTLAAKLLLDSDPDFALKRLDDRQILALLELYPDKSPTLEAFAKDLLASPRTDTVCKRAAITLYTLAGEPLPDPYDPQAALQRFSVQTLAIAPTPPAPPAPAAPTKNKKKMHTIEPGDNLWKIARKYKVSVDDLVRANKLESEKLRPGRQLEIPEKSEKR